jgi:hypothetical protein
MEKKHTPGPWEINEHAEITDGKYILGRVYCGDVFPCEDDELNSNAQLIAAAPDLLEVLSRITNCNDLATAQEYARQAIQKATGI